MEIKPSKEILKISAQFPKSTAPGTLEQKYFMQIYLNYSKSITIFSAFLSPLAKAVMTSGVSSRVQ
jgi:hypothetical protein